MSHGRWWLAAGLLALTVVPFAFIDVEGSWYGGWPALGFATGLLLVAGRPRLWAVLGVETLVLGSAVTLSYHASPALGLLAGLTVTLPALFTWWLLTDGGRTRPRLDMVDSLRYHTSTAASAVLCGLMAMSVAGLVLPWPEVLVVGLTALLGALTAQLAVLPLLVGKSRSKAAGGLAELSVERLVLLDVVIGVFWPTTTLPLVFLVFPPLAWAAVRATRRETHVQLFLVCVAVYALTSRGHGPLAAIPSYLPSWLDPALMYVFLAALCYLIVPLTLTVERLVSITGHASRAATTVARLLDSATHTLFIATDERGLITHYNTGAQRALGYSESEVLGNSPAMFHTDDEVLRQAAHFGVSPDYRSVLLAQAARGDRRDWALRRKDGSGRMASLSISAVTDASGGVVGHITAGEDITERLRAEAALTTALTREHSSVVRLQEVDHVKQELVSNVSHELRTPITSISGYAELLSDGALGELNRAQIDAVLRIERNTSRLGLLVEDLLTLSRAEADSLELERAEIDLREVASEGYELLEDLVRNRDLEVALDVPPEPVRVLGDRHALERVVINLLGNAIKFTPDSGHATLTVRAAPSGPELIVSDSGMGIAEKDQEHLFTRFFRTSAAAEHAIQGTGLGLSIVHAIVSQHGGAVAVDSAPGQGTTIVVTFPGVAC